LYQFCAASKPASSKSVVNKNKNSSQSDPLVKNQDPELENFLYNDYRADKSETNKLDKYMADSLLKQIPFDILAYWKNKTHQYPILSQIARDMMAIQVATVAFESSFSATDRVVDPYSNHLGSEMVQALICIKDWIHSARKGTNLDFWFELYNVYGCLLIL
jgi:hypothetical protein